MCTEFEKTSSRFHLLKSLLIIVLIALSIVTKPINSFAQGTPVSVSITVMPPFSTSLYDYINTPNKIMVTLTHTQLDYPDLEVYLKASIKSENGISVITEPGFKPSEPIFLARGKTFILNNQNISEAFNLEHTIIEGAELSELLSGAGLPEDFYQICIQVFDFNTDQPLSNEEPMGCSNLFNITNLEPPRINLPFCGEVVDQNPLQVVQIQWEVPFGALPGTLYHFEMVEIPEYSTIDPKEAFEVSAYPPIYEETTTLNSLMLTMQKIVLSPGYSYAFRVRAEDQSGKMNFRNGGFSEVCWFPYGKPVQANMGDKQIKIISSKDCSPDSVLIASPPDGLYTIWRIVPFDPQNYKDPLENLPGYQFRVEFFDAENAQKPIYSEATDKTSLNSNPETENLPFVSGNPYWVQVSIENMVSLERILSSDRCGFRYVYSSLSAAGMVKKAITGTLQYRFENQGATTYPVASSEVRLKCLYLLTDQNTGKQYEIPEADVLAGLEQGANFPSGLTQNPVASTVTSSNGNFSFHFSWPENAPLGEIQQSFTYQSTVAGSSTGKLVRALRVEIVNPYYSTPQTAVVYNETPYDMGEVISYVYSYELKAQLTKGYKKNSSVEENLVGKKIYIFRKQKLPGIPPNEGNQLGSSNRQAIPTELKTAGYYFVASAVAESFTNDKGGKVAKATFPRLIENLVNGDDYYWYAEGVGLGSAQPLSFSNNVGSTYSYSASSQLNIQSTSNNLEQNSAGQQYFFLNNSQSSNSGYATLGSNVGSLVSSQSGSSSSSGFTLNSNFEIENDAVWDIPGTSTLETSNVSISNTGSFSFQVDATLNVLSNDPPMSGIKGRLVYEFPGKPGNARPLANRKISLISCLVTNQPGQTSKIVKNNHFEENQSAFPHVQVLHTSTTDGAGNFNFQFPNIEPENPDPTSGSFEVSTGNLNRNASWQSWESDPEKYFRIVYESKQVKVKRVFRIVVDDPSGLFMSPDDNLTIDPLETVDVGMLTSNVMSYSLKGGVGWDMPNPNWNPGMKNPDGSSMLNVPIFTAIQGVECYVLRKLSEIGNYQLPSDEGQNVVGSLDELKDFKIISMSTSGSDGSFTFDNLLFRNCQVPVYLYFRTKDMLGDANFIPTMAGQNTLNPFQKPVYLFNADYKYTKITGFSTPMLPDLPTLKGKVTSNVAAGKGVAYANVTARFFIKKGLSNSETIEKTCVTDTAGYFDFAQYFIELKNQNELQYLENVQIEVKKKGFHYMKGNTRQESYVNTYDRTKFAMGKQEIVNVFLYGNGTIKGRIVNEQNNPVDAYVQFIASSFFGTGGSEGTMTMTGGNSNISAYALFSQQANKKGEFEIPAIPGSFRKLIVIPKDVTYFPDTIPVVVLENVPTNLGDIKVYERSHRITFDVREHVQVMQSQANLPVKGAMVELIGSPTPLIVYADNNGKVNMSFKNVSESNLSVKISGPTGSNYVPKVMSFTNFESDKVVQLPTVYLEKGLTVKGKVMLDGKPTSNAEVFVELKSWQTGAEYDETSQGEGAKTESQYLFKAYPKSDGTFEITTIPPELAGKQIMITAVYKKMVNMGGKNTDDKDRKNAMSETTPTVIGESKPVTAPNSTGSLELNLKTFNGMQITELWGFPIEITKILPQNSGSKVYVSGRVKLQGYSPGFDPLESLILEFSNVVYTPSVQMVDGKPIGIPDQDQVIVTATRGIKLKYAKAFNVQLSAPPNNALFTIVKDPANEGKGKLNAQVAIIDNSFQFPSSYLNFDGVNFNFCNKISLGNKAILSPVISVFNSSIKGNGNDVVKYNLCNLSSSGTAGDLNFKFINFDTRSNAANSTIEGNEITLAATLKANLKDAGELEIKIAKLVLKNNAISSVSGDTPIMITLNDGGIHDADKAWKFEAKNWRIDPKVGGVVSENCVLHTGSIDIPFSYFNLRSDFAYIGQPEASNINLGGYPITFNKLNQTGGAKVAVGYNASCGGDKKGHWQVIFYPPSNGDVPATVNGLPNMNNAPLELETVSLLSNGENVFSIGTGAKKMRLYNTVDFKPQSVFSLTDGFVLGGSADFHIPRVRDGVGARLIFVKNASASSNPKVDPIDLNFDGKGNIKFTTNFTGQAFNPTARTFTTYGTVEESGVLEPVQVKMTYFDNSTISQIRTEIVESPLVPNQTIKIGEANTLLEKVKCKTKADQNDWDLFVFEGDLAGAKGVSDDAVKHMVFTVHGEIKAEQNGFKADGIDTPFGGIQITYQKGRLIGTLNMVNVPLGSSMVNGVANLLMDSDGWAFYSNCRATNVPAPDACTLYMGILIGNYPKVLPEMKNTVLQYAIRKEMPPTFDKKLSGFYLVGGRELPISGLDVGIDVVVASAYVRVPVAALDAAFYLNLETGDEVFGSAVSGGIRVEFGLGSITCTDLSGYGQADVKLGVEAKTSGSLNLFGSSSFEAGLKVSQGVPYLAGCIDAVDISVEIGGEFIFNTTPFNVQFNLK